MHRSTVDHIVADLRPVRRLWPLSLRLAVWAAVEAGALLFVAHYSRHADLTQDLANPWYLLDIAAFILTGVVGATLALRAAIPGREPQPAETGFLIVLASASPLLLVHQPFNGTVPVGTFVDAGLPCALGTFTFAAIAWLASAAMGGQKGRAFVCGIRWSSDRYCGILQQFRHNAGELPEGRRDTFVRLALPPRVGRRRAVRVGRTLLFKRRINR